MKPTWVKSEFFYLSIETLKEFAFADPSKIILPQSFFVILNEFNKF